MSKAFSQCGSQSVSRCLVTCLCRSPGHRKVKRKRRSVPEFIGEIDGVQTLALGM